MNTDIEQFEGPASKGYDSRTENNMDNIVADCYTSQSLGQVHGAKHSGAQNSDLPVLELTIRATSATKNVAAELTDQVLRSSTPVGAAANAMAAGVDSVVGGPEKMIGMNSMNGVAREYHWQRLIDGLRPLEKLEFLSQLGTKLKPVELPPKATMKILEDMKHLKELEPAKLTPEQFKKIFDMIKGPELRRDADGVINKLEPAKLTAEEFKKIFDAIKGRELRRDADGVINKLEPAKLSPEEVKKIAGQMEPDSLKRLLDVPAGLRKSMLDELTRLSDSAEAVKKFGINIGKSTEATVWPPVIRPLTPSAGELDLPQIKDKA